jgi:uncharacterized membrane protein YfhO
MAHWREQFKKGIKRDNPKDVKKEELNVKKEKVKVDDPIIDKNNDLISALSSTVPDKSTSVSVALMDGNTILTRQISSISDKNKKSETLRPKAPDRVFVVKIIGTMTPGGELRDLTEEDLVPREILFG